MLQKESVQTQEDGGQDDDALARTALNDPNDFAILYRRYVNRIYRYLIVYTNSEKEAEDLTAEVFLAALNGLPRYRENGHFAAWLFAIARNKLTDSYRKKKPRLIHDLEDIENCEDGDSMPLTKIIHAEELERLSDLVGQLKPQQIELLQLRFSGRLTYAEIASIVGRSEAAVKMSIGRLLRRLQAQWELEHE